MIIHLWKKIIFFLFYFYFLFGFQGWSAITSLINATDIFVSSNNIYVSTNGGLLVLDKSFENTKILDFDDYISPLDLSSVYIDSNNNILLGGSGPIASIQVLDNHYNHINTVLLDGIEDISQIVQIIQFNDNIYAIGRGNGADLFIEFRFDDNRLYYQTIVNNLPLQNISTIYDLEIILEDNMTILLITTNQGVVKGQIVQNDIVWSIYSENEYENHFRDEIILDIYTRTNQDSFNVITNRALYNIINSDTTEIFRSPYDSDITNAFKDNDMIVLGIKNMGIYSFSIEDNSIFNKNMYIPETILQNKFTALSVNSFGTIFGISDNGGTIVSETDRIRNFTPYNKKKLFPVDEYLDEVSDFNQNIFFRGFSRSYRSGAKTPSNIIYSNWNSIYFTNPGITYDLNNIYNSPLVEIELDTYACLNYGVGDGVFDGMDGIVDINTEDSNYMAVNYLNKDEKGNLWVLNPYSENYNNILAVQNDNKKWYHLKDAYGLGLNSDNNSLLPTSFDFGPNNRIWVSFKKYSNQNGEIVSSGGIKILDYNGTIEDTSDDIWLELNNPEVLPSGSDTEIWSIIFSKNLDEDILWILTGSGIKGYIVNNLELIDYRQNFYDNISFDEFDKLKVDCQNNLWIVTRHSGVRVLSPDTSPWPSSDGITTSNSPILSNIIYDVAFNEDNGKVYFATEKGISIFESPFIKNPKEGDINEVLLSPNPLRLSENELLAIWNIFPGSKVRVMTLNGTVVKTFQLNNNQNKIDSWDGVLDNGSYISSGVYLITASHPDYKGRIGKLAVIR